MHRFYTFVLNMILMLTTIALCTNVYKIIFPDLVSSLWAYVLSLKCVTKFFRDSLSILKLRPKTLFKHSLFIE